MVKWSEEKGIVLAVAAVLSPIAMAHGAEPAKGICRAETFAELPVTMSKRRPLIKAKINGVEQFFLADSGAVMSMVMAAAAPELKLSPRKPDKNLGMRGIGGSFDVQVATAATFEIGGRVTRNVPFLVGSGHDDLAGMIGQNVLAAADTEYDLAARKIRLVKPSSCGEQAAVTWAAGQPFSVTKIEPITPRQRHIIGEATLNGIGLRAVFDTGSPTTLLSLAAARRAGINPGDPGVVPAGSSAAMGGVLTQSWLAPSASFRLGDRDMRGDPIRIADINGMSFDLLIGADFFLAHRVYVASSLGRLYFVPISGVPGGQSLPLLADAAAYARRANEFVAKRDVANAIADMNRAIEIAPNEPRYLVQRAMVRLGAQQALLARHDLDEAIRKKPDLADARVTRAMLFAAEGNVAMAREDLAAASRALPRDADQRFGYAAVYAGMDEWRGSHDQFDMWIASHPGDPRLSVALNGRCWAGSMLNDALSRALDDCNAALRLAPDNLYFRDSRGLALLRLGRLDEAIADYDAVLAKHDDLGWSYLGRGLARIRKGREREGQADLAAAIALSPRLPQKAAAVGLIKSANDPR